MHKVVENCEPGASWREQATIELELLVRAGSPHASEAVLSKFSELAGDEEFLLELVYLEHVLRQEQSVDSPTEDLLVRFPQLGEELSRMLEVDKAFNESRLHPTLFAAPGNTQPGTQEAASQLVPTQTRFGDYILLERIGQGGMGVVYRAQQTQLNRVVAIKMLDAFGRFSESLMSSLRSEAELIAGLQHPNIVQVYGAGIVDGIPFFSMEYVAGGTLAESVSQQTLRPQHAAHLLETLARAVAYAHSRGVIHRDLKPANILLVAADKDVELTTEHTEKIGNVTWKSLQPKIVDFGLAKHLSDESQMSRTGGTIGTPSYMSPEQIESGPNSVGVASDIYSLGAILYHTLLGRPPFVGVSALETFRQLREETPISPRSLDPTIPGDLETICLTCLNKDPSRRYPTALALADDLRRFLASEPIRARPSGWLSRTAKWVRRHPAPAFVIAIACVTLIALAGLWSRAETQRAKADHANDLARRAVYAQSIQLAQFELGQGDWRSTLQELNDTPPELRDFEWYYLREKCQQPIFHQEVELTANSVAISPDGRLVAVGTRGPFSTNQKGRVTVWEVETQREIYSFDNHPGPVNCVRFSPDGDYLASAGVYFGPQDRGGFYVWRLSDGELHFGVENVEVTALAFSPNGGELAMGHYHGPISIYSMIDGKKIKTFYGHSSFVTGLAYRPDGKYLASVNRDTTLRVWSLSDATPHPPIVGMRGGRDLRQVQWSCDGRSVFVADFEASISVLEQLDDNSLIESQYLDKPGIKAITLSPDDQFLLMAVKGTAPVVVDRLSGTQLGKIPTVGYTRDMGFDRTGRRLVVGTGSTVQVWNLGECLDPLSVRFKAAADIASVDIHPKLDHAVLARKLNPRRPIATSGEPRIEVQDLTTGSIMATFETAKVWPTMAVFDHSGEKIVIGDEKGKIKIWSVSSQTMLREFDGHAEAINGLVIPAGGDQIVTSADDGTLKIWDLESGEIVHQWRIEENVQRCIGSRGSPFVFALTGSGSIRIFDCRVLGEWGTINACSKNVTALKMSEDGNWLGVAHENGNIEVWQVSEFASNFDASPTQSLRGNAGAAAELAFSGGGTRLLSAGNDMNGRLWDLSSGYELLSLGMRSAGHDLHMLFFGGDRAVSIWDLDSNYQWAVRGTNVESDSISEPQWHKWQLDLAQRKNFRQLLPNHYAEMVHLTRLMELEPDSDWQRHRASARIKARELEAAYEDLVAVYQSLKSTSLQSAAGLVSDGLKQLAQQSNLIAHSAETLAKFETPTADYRLLMDLARCATALDRSDEARQWCQQLGETYRDKPSLTKLNAWALSAATLNLEKTDWLQLIEFYEQHGTAAKRDSYLNTLALVEFRAGHYDTALKYCEQETKKSLESNAPFGWLVAALCNARKGNQEQTDKLHQLALEWVSQQQALEQKGLRGSPNFVGTSRSEIQSLLGELAPK